MSIYNNYSTTFTNINDDQALPIQNGPIGLRKNPFKVTDTAEQCRPIVGNRLFSVHIQSVLLL
jgi:hypothetical protein